MNSDNSDEDEHDPISKQIVDYYRKFSQNRQLPKYFSGTSMSYLPQIVKDDEIRKPQIIIEDTSNVVQSKTENPLVNVDEGAVVSPASSVTSNRKLEWDNGADIGYSNCNKSSKLHKSISLPTVLSDDKNEDNPIKPKLTTQVVTVISYSSPSEDSSNNKPLPSSSSSSSSFHVKVPPETSSSSSKVDTKPIGSSSNSSLAYIKSKIGTPDAESTPKLSSDIYKTCLDRESETPKIEKNVIRKKIVNLCVTKPIVIECYDIQKKQSAHQEIQTSIIEGLCKSVQTSDSREFQSDFKPPRRCSTENQSLILINYDSEKDKRVCSSNTQTDSDIVASNCDSFEFYGGKPDSQVGNDNLKRSQVKSDLVLSSDSSKEVLLGQLISQKQSRSLIGDIDRSIEILQKLLKSKKYDSATKKRYIKKIIEKIVNNQYNEDSTTSSELFKPKRKNGEKMQQKLQENIPWYPPKMSKFTVKTFSNEYLPLESQSEPPKKKSVFTMSKPENIPSIVDSNSSGQQKSTSSSYQSWKEDKTLSERLLEEKQKGQGDQLVKFSMKERQNQISWINDEISYLTKLKGLLEQRHVETVQRTTTVYMVSQKYNNSDNSNYTSDSSQHRNYVIQTELSGTSSSDKIDFNYHDKTGRSKYRVREIPGSSKEKNGENLMGEIQVSSDEKTTNIKVKATQRNTQNGEIFKPKEPALVGGSKFDTFPKSRTEEFRYLPCCMREMQRFDGSAGPQQYSVELPLSANKTSITKQVEEIINKYSKNKNDDEDNPCVSGCKCCRMYKKEKELCGKVGHICIFGCNCAQKKDDAFRKICSPHVQCVPGCKCKGQKSSIEREICNKNVDCVSGCECKKKKVCSKDVQCAFGCTCKITEDETKKTCNKDVQCVFGCECNKPKVVEAQKIVSHKDTQCVLGCGCQTEERKICDKDTQCVNDCKCKEKTNGDGCQSGTVKYKDADDENKAGPSRNVTSSTDGSYKSRNSSRSKEQKDCPCSDDTKKEMVDTKLQTICICKDNAKSQTDECICYTKEDLEETTGSLMVATESQSTSETSTSSDSESSTSSTGTVRSCSCCKRKNVTSKTLYALRKKLSDQAYPLCRPCYRQHRTGVYSPNFHTNPTHVCNCYTAVETKTLEQIKQTITDLNDLDQYCTCVNVTNKKKSGYCKHCKCKLKKTSKNKNGIAYMLTFENENVRKRKKKKHKKPSLEEIKIKIPIYKKKHKDKENKRKKEKTSNESETTETSKGQKVTLYTLQEYLNRNRPDFVEVAEGRRKAVEDSKAQRQEVGDCNKLLLLQKYCQDNCDKNFRRVFSSKEMKEITKKNYQKLPEVQQKLIDNREKQIRQANRLMADTFNRKLRENVLKGKRSLPTDVTVVGYNKNCRC